VIFQILDYLSSKQSLVNSDGDNNGDSDDYNHVVDTRLLARNYVKFGLGGTVKITM
jgi:hypothetical protein